MPADPVPRRTPAPRRRRRAWLAIVLTAAALAAALLVWHPWRYRVVLTREDLQANVERQFPIERRELLLTLRLFDPIVLLNTGSDRIGLGVSLSATAPFVKPVRGRAELDGVVRFEPDTGELYLDAARLARLRMSGVADRDLEAARQVVNAALPQVLARIPVYRLREGRWNDLLGRRVLRDVAVRRGRLVIELGP